jgi:DNA (cytosine-5)-methyltransferase 1
MQTGTISPKSNKSWETKRKKFTFIDLFAGIGGFRIALESFNGKCVFSSEWDEKSQTTYYLNFGEVPRGDITKINEKDIPKHNILCAGFPCQAFSVSGKRKGFNDARGTLFFDIARIVRFHKPEVLFLENVKNFIRHDNGKTLEIVKNTIHDLGYDFFFKVLRSSDFGVPQARERVYMIGFRKDLNIKKFEYPEPSKGEVVIKDILEDEKLVPIKTFISRPDIKIYKKDIEFFDKRSPLQIGAINNGGQGERIYSIHASGITLSAYGGGAASKTGAFLIKGKVRKLTPRECARLQGFPEDFELPKASNTAYKQFGDSVSIPVLKAVFKNVLKYTKQW